MDTRTGEVISDPTVTNNMHKPKPINSNNLPLANQRQLELTGKTKIGPNTKCPCGSGKKFKRCCQAKNGLGRTYRKVK